MCWGGSSTTSQLSALSTRNNISGNVNTTIHLINIYETQDKLQASIGELAQQHGIVYYFVLVVSVILLIIGVYYLVKLVKGCYDRGVDAEASRRVNSFRNKIATSNINLATVQQVSSNLINSTPSAI